MVEKLSNIPKIYLETSILNFVFADDSPEKKTDTIKLFGMIKDGAYRPFTSEYVREEIGKTPDKEKMNDMYRLITEHGVNVLRNTEETERLAAEYVKERIIPEKHMTDALHIAAATVNELDIILSWNFQHIVKRKTIIMTEAINLRNGYKKVEIYSPTEVIKNV